MAECSLSIIMNLASISPFSTISAHFSDMEVWGVMGYTATTSALASRAPWAAA